MSRYGRHACKVGGDASTDGARTLFSPVLFFVFSLSVVAFTSQMSLSIPSTPPSLAESRRS
jgi:hypothetical protein